MSEFIQGKTVVINQPSYALYTLFSDPSRIAATSALVYPIFPKVMMSSIVNIMFPPIR